MGSARSRSCASSPKQATSTARIPRHSGRLGEAHGYEAQISWTSDARDGCFDVLFTDRTRALDVRRPAILLAGVRRAALEQLLPTIPRPSRCGDSSSSQLKDSAAVEPSRLHGAGSVRGVGAAAAHAQRQARPQGAAGARPSLAGSARRAPRSAAGGDPVRAVRRGARASSVSASTTTSSSSAVIRCWRRG